MTLPRKRFRFQVLSFVALLVILAATAASVAEQARWVDLVALIGSSFGAGATLTALLAQRRLLSSPSEPAHG